MKILVIKPSSLGDILHTLPAVRVIKENFPGSHLSWIVSESCSSLLNLVPDVNESLIFRRQLWSTFRGFSGAISFLHSLKRKHFDIVLDFQGLLRSGMMTWVANSPRKYGFSNAREGAVLFYKKRITPPQELRHAVEKNIFLVNSVFNLSASYLPPVFNFPKSVTSISRAVLQQHAIKDNAVIVAVAPAARWKSKMWPMFFFQKLSIAS